MTDPTFTPEALTAATRRHVIAQPVVEHGRKALQVHLEPGLGPEHMIDKPTFVIVPMTFVNGLVEVDILSRLLPDAPSFARGFAGAAFRISRDVTAFEAVYLRPLNGRPMNPPPPRDRRAVQYFAYPDWDFERLRHAYPDGSYEAGADIAPDTWMNLKLEIRHRRITASVDGRAVLAVDSKVEPAPGRVGLWVDIGTEAFFADLRVTAS